VHAMKALSHFILVILAMVITSNSAWGARRALKKRAEVPSQWYGSADITYTNWIKDKWEGGGESRIAGMQFGLHLPWNMSSFLRISAMPQPDGFQDIRAGLSKSIIIDASMRNTLSTSFSAPTSDYSRSIHQKTQASAASTLEYYRGAATLSFTGYVAKAYYSDDGAISSSEPLQLRNDRSNKPRKTRPPSASPLTVNSTGPDDEIIVENIEVNYGDVIFMTRFDHLWGGALDLTYRFTSEWAVNTAGSITQSVFTTDEAVWSCDVTLVQVTYSRKLLSVFAGTGLLDSGPVLHWPGYKTYTVGTSYLLPN
jgi:hypothetical protein